MFWERGPLTLVIVIALSGCATVPTGPSVMVLPAPGKSFELFQADDLSCRQWAGQQGGAGPGQAYNQTLAEGAAVGTLLGAGLGAAIGAASGNPGVGAAIGAASGLLGGTAVAAGPAYASAWEVQSRYDIAYQQCMYAKGNQLPAFGRAPWQGYWVPPPPPPPPSFAPVLPPPPPPNAPPPPPFQRR